MINVRLLLVSGLCLCLAATTACASAAQQERAQDAGSSATASGTAVPFVQTSEWAGLGARIDQAKAAAISSSPSGLPIDAGPWSYETTPIDVIGNGPIVLSAKVPSSLVVTGGGSALAYDFPPDAAFEVAVQKYDETANGDGTSEINVYAEVTGFKTPYEGFQAWLY